MHRTAGRGRGGRRTGRLGAALLLLACLLAVPAPSVLAQVRGELVEYRNATDGMPLGASLHLPPGQGPFPALVVLSLAGVGGLTDRLAEAGWAVMVPERRGMGGAPELELDAGFGDMAGDVAAALEHLRGRADIDGGTVGLLAQGGETMVGMAAAVAPSPPSFLVLVSPRGLPGARIFRIQQERSARSRRLDAGEADALDRQVERLLEIARSPGPPSLRAYRIRSLLSGASVRPHQSSSLPPDLEGQVRFLASRWWHDFAVFTPDTVLSRVEVPTLVLEGDDPFLALEENLPPVRRSLEGAPVRDVTVCVVPGRVEHGFPTPALDALSAWMSARRVGEAGFVAGPDEGPPGACLEDPGTV